MAVCTLGIWVMGRKGKENERDAPTDANCEGSRLPLSAVDDWRLAGEIGPRPVQDLMGVAVVGNHAAWTVGMHWPAAVRM